MIGAEGTNDGPAVQIPPRRAYGGRVRRKYSQAEKADLKAQAVYLVARRLAGSYGPAELEAAFGVSRASIPRLKRRGKRLVEQAEARVNAAAERSR